MGYFSLSILTILSELVYSVFLFSLLTAFTFLFFTFFWTMLRRMLILYCFAHCLLSRRLTYFDSTRTDFIRCYKMTSWDMNYCRQYEKCVYRNSNVSCWKPHVIASSDSKSPQWTSSTDSTQASIHKVVDNGFPIFFSTEPTQRPTKLKTCLSL